MDEEKSNENCFNFDDFADGDVHEKSLDHERHDMDLSSGSGSETESDLDREMVDREVDFARPYSRFERQRTEQTGSS